jgi:phytoene dehydrogenase-like protein
VGLGAGREETVGDVRDVVVVGGGLAGLAAASYLARGGLSVEVLERAETAGGRARTREQDGFAFNLGPHALYRRGAAAAVLRELDVPYSGAPPRSGYRAVVGTRLTALPTTPGALLTARLLPLRAKVQVARWYAALSRTRAASLAGLSVDQWLGRVLPHPAARALAETLVRVTTYAVDTQRHSAAAVLRQLRLAQAGVLYLHGGWQTLVDGLRARLAERGIEPRTRAEVAAVRRTAAGFQVSLADGTAWNARAVVLAVPPGAALALVEDPPPALAEAASAAVPVRAACLDVALSRLPRPEHLVSLGVDRPLYLSVHSAVARLAPEGGALVHAARYLRADEAGAPAERELEELLDVVQPGWREALVRRRFLGEMVVANALVTAARGRAPVELAEAPGLVLAGDWVGDEGLLADASLASARRAAQALLSRLRSRPAA